MTKTITQYVFISLLIISGIHTPPRVESLRQGTVVLVDVIENEVVFSADSRATAPDGSHMDNDCKLATFKNDAIFTASGERLLSKIVGGKRQLWDSHTLAQEAIRMGRLRQGKDTLALLAAQYWAIGATNFFQAIVNSNSTYFPRYKQIANAAFASRDKAGNLSVYTIAVQVENDPLDAAKGRVVQTIRSRSVNQSAMFGNPPILQEFLLGQSQRAKDATIKWQSTLPQPISDLEYDERIDVQLIQWAIDFSNDPLIGGDANAVVLDRKGIRWLAQKDYCKTAE